MQPLVAVLLAFATLFFGLGMAVHRGDILKSAPPWVEVLFFVLSGALYILAFVLAIIHYRKDSRKKDAHPAAHSQNQHLEANPQQIVNIGRDLFGPPKPAEPTKPKQEDHPPNIRVGDPRIARLRIIHHLSSDLISWTEEPDGKQKGLLLCFRNESIARLLGIGFVNWRCLRTSCATWMVQAGADPKSVQGQMRHSRISTTMEIYAQFVPEGQRRAVNQMAEYARKQVEEAGTKPGTLLVQ